MVRQYDCGERRSAEMVGPAKALDPSKGDRYRMQQQLFGRPYVLTADKPGKESKRAKWSHRELH